MQECVVCHQPVCRPSLIKCPTCGRGTCQAHRNLCHANDGQPAVLAADPPLVKDPAPPPPSPPKTKPAVPSAKGRATQSAPVKKPPPKPTGTKSPPKLMPKGVRIDINILETEPTVVAFVMRSANKVLATRSFQLTPKGIFVRCQCEKSPCPADGYYYRPWPVTNITRQLEEMLAHLRTEYLVPSKKVNYFLSRNKDVRPTPKLILSGSWLVADLVNDSMRGFDEMRD